MSEQTTFSSVSPVFMSRDLDATSQFYTTHLGFDITSRYDDYLILQRGGISLHFSLTPHLDPKTNSCHAYVYVTNVAALYEQCAAAEIVHPNAPLRVQDYGMIDFAVFDQDGNLLTFGEEMPR